MRHGSGPGENRSLDVLFGLISRNMEGVIKHTHNLLALNVCGPFFFGLVLEPSILVGVFFWGESTVQDFWQ